MMPLVLTLDMAGDASVQDLARAPYLSRERACSRSSSRCWWLITPGWHPRPPTQCHKHQVYEKTKHMDEFILEKAVLLKSSIN
jgi:hypothetical protein